MKLSQKKGYKKKYYSFLVHIFVGIFFSLLSCNIRACPILQFSLNVHSLGQTPKQLPVQMLPCKKRDETQLWKFEQKMEEVDGVEDHHGRLVHATTGKCLDAAVGIARHNRTAFVQTCGSGDDEEGRDKAQEWRFITEHAFNDI